MSGSQVFDWMVSLANFGIMFLLFRLVVILPMQEAVRLREQRVALRLKEIEELARDAEETKASFQERFGQVETVLAEVKEISDRSLSQARQKLEERTASEERYISGKAEAEAESIRRDAEAKVRSQVAGSAVSKAEAFLVSALDVNAQDKIMSASIVKLGELSVN